MSLSLTENVWNGIILSSFFSTNITAFLPIKISYLTPLLFGLFGFYLIRIEFSGNKLLDKVNTNFNSSNFNALLTLLVIFALIKYIPPLLNWFVFDANFAGNTKEDCTGGGACWVFVKVWLNRFVYGCLLYTSPSPRDVEESRMPSSA